MSRVNWGVMRGWITRRTEELLGFEDEVLNGYIAEQLEGQEVSWRRKEGESRVRYIYEDLRATATSLLTSSSPFAQPPLSLLRPPPPKKKNQVRRPARPPDQPHALPRGQDAQVRRRAVEAAGLGVDGGALGRPAAAPRGRGQGPGVQAEEAAEGGGERCRRRRRG